MGSVSEIKEFPRKATGHKCTFQTHSLHLPIVPENFLALQRWLGNLGALGCGVGSRVCCQARLWSLSTAGSSRMLWPVSWAFSREHKEII